MGALATQRTSTVAISQTDRCGQGSAQWFLEKGESKITQNNTLKFFICGEEGFGHLYDDLRNAQATVDIICWGFDPGMELVRTGDTWKRGMTLAICSNSWRAESPTP